MKKINNSLLSIFVIFLTMKGFGQCIPTVINQPTSTFGLCNASFGSVATNGIGCNAAYFSQVLTQTLCVIPGTANSFNARITANSGPAAMWFDLNQDNIFTLSELVFNGVVNTNYAYSLPANIAPGQYKVRAITNWGGSINSSNPCGNYYDGQDFVFTLAHTPVNNLSLSTTTISPCIGVTTTLSVVNTGTDVISGYSWTSYDPSLWSNNVVGTNTLSTVTLDNLWESPWNPTAVVTYTNGCKNTISMTYTVNPNPGSISILSGVGISTLCANSVNSLSYDLNTFNGTVSNTLWFNGSTASTTTLSVGSSPVSASVTLTRNDGCVFTQTATLQTGTTTPTPPTPNISPSATICANTNLTVSFSNFANPGYSYNWNDGTTGNFKIFHPDSDSTLNITYFKSGFVCSGTLVKPITVIASPTVSISNATICIGNSYTLSPSGATSYTYSGGSAVVSPTAITIYTVTGSNGTCSTSKTLTITPIPSTVTISVSNGTICSGNSFTISPSGATNYTYSSGSSVVSPTATSVYTVTGEAGTCSQTKTLSVLVNTVAIPAFTGSASISICSGNTASLTASSPGVISWFASPTGTTALTTGTVYTTPTLTSNASYYISATSNGCESARAVKTVTIIPLPAQPVNLSSSIGLQNNVCSGNIAEFYVGSNCNWYTSATGGTSFLNANVYSTPTLTATTTYYVDRTVNGCTSAPRVALVATVNPMPSVLSQTVQNLTCNGLGNGSISLTLNNPSSFSYDWTPNVSTTYSATSLAAGIYTVQISSGAGLCVTTQTYNVTQPTAYNVPVNIIGGNILNFNDSYVGGTTFQWLDCNNGNAPIIGAVNAQFTPTVSGSYALVVTDNCASTSTCTSILVTGINENTVLNNITLLPNPASTYIALSNVVEGTSVSVIDVTGKIIASNSVIDTDKTMTIETSNLSNGIYVIQLKNNGAVAYKKLIISK